MSYERYNYHKSTLENQSVGIYQCCIYQALFVFRIKSPVGRGNDGCYYLLRGNVKVSDSQINLLINIHTGNDEEDSRAPGTPGQQAAQPEDDCPLVLLTMILNNSKDKRFPNYGRCVDGGRQIVVMIVSKYIWTIFIFQTWIWPLYTDRHNVPVSDKKISEVGAKSVN